MDFFIKVKATRPVLKMELIEDGRHDYRNFYDLLQNAELKFSMYDAKTGAKRISMADAKLFFREDCCDTEDESYYIGYEWKEKDTKKEGTFIGEFTITFLEDGTVLKAPIRERLSIHILDHGLKK